MSPRTTKSESCHGSPTNADFYDLISVGFGPASLAIAVALRDLQIDARVLFLERQPQFAWHAGMLLPSTRMQISHHKDLATLRTPRSHFTFLNYLKEKGRLEHFVNLATFFPLREEFNDYLTWAAEHFNDAVKYGIGVQTINGDSDHADARVDRWTVDCRRLSDDSPISFTSKKLIIAVGGSPKLPRSLGSFGPKLVHSSQYLKAIQQHDWKDGSSSKFAVIGGGQSAAEIFNDLMSRFPKAQIKMFLSGSTLKPSDDSPFVNEIFNPDQVDEIFGLNDIERRKAISENRPTNYSVVRPELLNHLYEAMYLQRLREPDSQKWSFQIQGSRELCGATQMGDEKVTLSFSKTRSNDKRETVEPGFDLVFVGTGYTRQAHAEILQPIQHLLEDTYSSVERDYRLKLKKGVVGPDCGIWLQGCCETSHGLSDSLLSIIAVRGGELVESMFGKATTNDVSPMTKKNGFTNGSH